MTDQPNASMEVGQVETHQLRQITPQLLWENHYKKFADDFNSMTDDEIESEKLIAEYQVDQHTEWLEAIAIWKKIGCPRTPKPEESQ